MTGPYTAGERALAGELTADQVLVGHQPAYLPWCGYLSRLLDVDRFLVLDHVAFSGGWQQRNYIAGPAARPTRLVTVPVIHRSGQAINQARICGDRWRSAHWRYLVEGYRRAPYWPDWQERLAAIYQRPWRRLIELNLALFALLCEAFAIEVELLFSSDLVPGGRKTCMLIDLCARTGAKALRVGAGATYLDWRALAEAGIAIQVATWHHPVYPRTGQPHVPGLSALDLLMHRGPEEGRKLLAAGGHLAWQPPQTHPCAIAERTPPRPGVTW